MQVEISPKLWDLANVITGFSVAQAIVYLYALATKDGLAKHILCSGWTKIFVVGAIGAFHVLYILAILWCHQKMRSYEDDTGRQVLKDVSYWVKRGQITIVVLFGFLTLVITLLV